MIPETTRRLTQALLAASLALAGCALPSAAREEAPAASPGLATDDFYMGSGDIRGRAENRFSTATAAAGEATVAPAPRRSDRLMTYSARIDVEVPRIADAVARCQAEVARIGGWISARHGSALTCRVPAADFERFLAWVRGQGRVLDESMEAHDVTDQHRDLRIRLENARKARDRLLALLEEAEAVEDVLAIEKELQRLTEEIERTEARLAGLDERIAYSIVTVALRAPADSPAQQQRRPSPFGWINRVGAEQVLRSF